MNYKPVHKCRSCGSEKLKDILDLGKQKIVEFTNKPIEVPLELIQCQACTLVQLRHTTSPELLWNEGYGYRSGVNDAMVKHLHGIAHEAEKYLEDGDTVLDIGCNDGSLLDGYTKKLNLIGIDPSKNVASYIHKTLKDKEHLVVYDFFNKKAYQSATNKKAKVITAISMFYDLEDPNTFIEDIKECLDDNGVFIVQQNYLGTMISNCAFDNICHEHLEYYSLISMQNLLSKHGLVVFRVEQNDLNGGSIRTYICRIGDRPLESSVEELVKKEGLIDVSGFGEKIGKLVEHINMTVNYLCNQGKTIYAYGASTRGGTLLQACGLGPKEIKKAVERNPDKWGKIMESTGIPIISEAQARKEKPDYMIILPWFFADHFIEREKEYVFGGGHFIIPIPKVKII